MRSILFFFAFISIAGAAGYLQNEDFKTEAELVGAGGSVSQLLNDTKIYVTGNGINKTLDDAIVDGDIGGGGTLTAKGELQGHNGTDEASVPAASGDGLFLVSDLAEATGLKYTNTLSGAFNPVTDWQSFTPTGSWVTNTTYEGFYKEVGDTVEIIYRVNLTGAPTAALLELDPPPGITIDAAKQLEISGQTTSGTGQALDNGTARYDLQINYRSAQDAFAVQFLNSSGSSATVSGLNATSPFTFTSGDAVFLRVTAATTGTSGLDSVIERKFLAEVQAAGNAGQVMTANVTDIPFIEISDNINGWDGDSFTADKDGLYLITGGTFTTVASTASIRAYINGIAAEYIGLSQASSRAKGFSGTIKLSDGDVLSLRFDNSVTLTNDSSIHLISITEKQSDTINAAVFKKCQTKFLSADINSDTTDISDLRFSNMKNGANYQVIISPRYNFTTNDNIQFDALTNGSTICREVTGSSASNTHNLSASKTCYFTSAATTMTVNLSSLAGGNSLLGNGSLAETGVTLCEESMSFTTEF